MAQVRLNNAMVGELQKSFSLRDYNKEGVIYADDIAAVIRSVHGLKPSEDEIQIIVSEVNKLGGSVNLQNLVQYISQYCTNPEQENPRDVAEMFKMFDKEGRGFISVSELKHLLTSVGEKLSDEEAEDIINQSGCVDRRSNSVDYMKFVQTVMQ